MSKSNKTVCVIDNGLFQPLAHCLSKHFNRVLYFREWKESFPSPQDVAIGEGYNDIECVDSLMGAIKDTDLFVFPDIYWAEEQAYLRSIGKKVFGAGDAERLELYRHDFSEAIKELGMPVIPHEMVKGVKRLRERLEKVEDKYVKVSFVRGLMETWHHCDYRISKPKVDEIEYNLGCLSEDQEFMVEDAMEAKRENGSDQIVVDGRFPKIVQHGVEGKDKTYLAEMIAYSSLPKEVRQVNEWIAPLLKSYKYRCYFSTEIRVGKKDNKPYLIDPCCRHASPAGETFNTLCGNLGEMIEAAAEGELVDPKPVKRFAAQAIITSDIAETMSVPIYINPKVREWVHLYHSGIREDGQECVFKTDAQMAEIGSVVGIGNTIDEAIKQCREHAEGIECYKSGIYTDQLEDAIKDFGA